MKNLPANEFFNDIDFIAIVDNIKGIYTSDGSMATLLDFERVLDDQDVYAFRNWSSGELVDGPNLGRYDVTCTFMWPYRLMPDPRAALRLTQLGCTVTYGKGEIQVPVQVENYDDFVPGTHYPKMQTNKVWFVEVRIPIELMKDVKEGSVDLAGQSIDLSDLEDAYNKDLDTMTGDQAQEEANKEAAEDSGLEI